MKVLVTGAGGQVASALEQHAPATATVNALSREQLDITDQRAVVRAVEDFRPDAVINAAAYTKVDRAETEQSLARSVNVDGPANLAQAALACGARLLHISTDFVFDGLQSSPYRPTDTPHPLGVYGKSKLEGENRVREILGDNALILRTAWVYAAKGSNFVLTMLRLMRERDEIGVVEDQVGSPTCASSIALLLWRAVDKTDARGIFHWTDAGVASWYDFAVAIQEEAVATGLLDRKIPVYPIATSEYPTPAKRPAFSVLDRNAAETIFELKPSHWRTNLRQVLSGIKDG